MSEDNKPITHLIFFGGIIAITAFGLSYFSEHSLLAIIASSLIWLALWDSAKK
jgi:ABC-type transport system involved in cytochrome c biogenesis permease component